MREHIDLVRAWRAIPPGEEAVLATVVATRGSVYRRPGARMLLTREGWVAGSISGGCIESDLVQTAFERTADGPVLVTYDASAPDDVLLGFGLGCSGAVDVLMQRLPEDGGPLAAIERVLRTREPVDLATFARGEWRIADRGSRIAEEVDPKSEIRDRAILTETLVPPPALVVFGAGHDAVPLARVANGLGWRVTVVDGRAAYAKPERFPESSVVVAPPSRAVGIERDAAVVLMTHSFANDAAILGWLPRDLPYVGVLGPIHRTHRLLEKAGVPTADLYAPIGLDLGADGPDEIALAIVAEILAVRKRRAGGHLKGRMRLHEPREVAHVGRLG